MHQKYRLKLALLSLVGSIVILSLKFLAYKLSGSTALKSDAYEGVVNVAASFFALGAVIFAEKPADRNHPYGHGKIEHFSAVFEGGLVVLAAMLIIYEAIQSMMYPRAFLQLGLGISVNLLSGVLNGVLGYFLIKQGQKHSSKAIEADGHHVFSDFLTTLGIAIGLLLVYITGYAVLDAVTALLVGFWLVFVGFRLIQKSASALLDIEDPKTLEKVVFEFNKARPKEVITAHDLKTYRSGRFTHVDVHLVVPEILTVKAAHQIIERFGVDLLTNAKIEGEVHSHTDPCEQSYCKKCEYEPCPIRLHPKSETSVITLEMALSTDHQNH